MIQGAMMLLSRVKGNSICFALTPKMFSEIQSLPVNKIIFKQETISFISY